METRANYALIGTVTIALVALAMLFAMWLAQAQLNREYALYDVVFEGPARGIGRGTEVRFNGIRVGEVASLRMDEGKENRVVARVRIQAQWPVRADSEVRLEPIGLTGLNLIQISAGAGKGALLRQQIAGPVPRINARQGAFDEILNSSETIAANTATAVEGARDLLTPENVKTVTRILNNLDRISADLASQRGALNSAAEAAAEWRIAAQRVNATAGELELLSAQARKQLTAYDDPIARILANSEAATAGVAGAAGNVDALVSTATAQTLPDLSLAANDLRRLSVTLDRMAADVERSPTYAAVSGQKPTVRVRP
jgi:phospholipid/cholesterol/gamma-HCH transport system substrate-binding protein